MTSFQLAQINIATMKMPLESPQMAGFVSRLAEINALADQSPGFVWRLQTDEGDATYLRPFEDDRILVNMSVWESVEAFEELHLPHRACGAPARSPQLVRSLQRHVPGPVVGSGGTSARDR